MANKIEFRVLTDISQFETEMAKVSKTAFRVGKNLTAGLTLPLSLAAGGFTKLASDAKETRNKFVQVMGDMTEEADKFTKRVSEGIGRNRTDLEEGLAAFQSFFKGLGFGSREAFTLSSRLQELSLDFASFNNLSDEEALQRFISALSGSSEVVDRFGINLKQANLELKLQELGLASTISEATETQKAIARLAIIEEALGAQGAVGDAVRTQGEFAGTLKRFQAAAKTLGQELGERLIPIFTRLLNAGIPIIQRFSEMSIGMQQTILVTAALAAALGPLSLAFGALAGVIGFILSPIGLTVTALGILAVAFIQNFSKIREFVFEAVRNIIGFIEDLKARFLTIQLTFQNINATPLKDRLLNPIETFKNAVADAEGQVASLKQNTKSEFDEFVGNTNNALFEAEEGINNFKSQIIALKNEFTNITAGPVQGPLTEEESQAAAGDVGAESGTGDGTPGSKLLDSFVPKPEAVEERFNLLESLKAAFIGTSNRLDASSKNSVKTSEKQKLGFIEATAQGGYLANLKFAKLSRALSIKEALINTYTGVSRAFKDYKFPFSLVVAAITLARGLATVSQISGVGFQQGASNLPDDTLGFFNKSEIIVPTSFSEGIRSGELSLVGGGQGAAGGGPYFDFRGATFNGVNDTLVEDIFKKAGEKIFDKTLVPLPGV